MFCSGKFQSNSEMKGKLEMEITCQSCKKKRFTASGVMLIDLNQLPRRCDFLCATWFVAQSGISARITRRAKDVWFDWLHGLVGKWVWLACHAYSRLAVTDSFSQLKLQTLILSANWFYSAQLFQTQLGTLTEGTLKAILWLKANFVNCTTMSMLVVTVVIIVMVRWALTWKRRPLEDDFKNSTGVAVKGDSWLWPTPTICQQSSRDLAAACVCPCGQSCWIPPLWLTVWWPIEEQHRLCVLY